MSIKMKKKIVLMKRKNGHKILHNIFLYLGTLLYDHYYLIKAKNTIYLKAHDRPKKDIWLYIDFERTKVKEILFNKLKFSVHLRFDYELHSNCPLNFEVTEIPCQSLYFRKYSFDKWELALSPIPFIFTKFIIKLANLCRHEKLMLIEEERYGMEKKWMGKGKM